MEYEKSSEAESEIKKKFTEKTGLDKEFRGIMINLSEREIVMYSPDEPNPNKIPTRQGQNVFYRLLGYWIQKNGEFKNEVLEEGDAGDEDMTESKEKEETEEKEVQETKKERMARYRSFYKTIGDRFNGTGQHFEKREKFLGIFFKEATGAMGARYFNAWGLRDAYLQFGDYVEKMVTAYAKRGQVIEFALFGDRRLLVASTDFQDPITQIMVGEAIRYRHLDFPNELIKEDSTNSYFILQDRNKGTISFEERTNPVGQAVAEFRRITAAKAEMRGIMIYANNPGIFAFSPTEPNPTKDPYMKAYNPMLRLCGMYIQSKGLMKAEIYSDKEAGYETLPKIWETNDEIVDRIRSYSASLSDKFDGHGKKFVKR